jgi:hypothetical protein
MVLVEGLNISLLLPGFALTMQTLCGAGALEVVETNKALRTTWV